MQKAWRTCCVPLLMSLVCWSCSKAPSGILSEKKMQEVMTDVYLAESIIGINHKDYQSDSMKQALYESVFRKHQITQAVYDSSLMWYGRNMDIYMGVYNRMIDDLQARIDDLGDIQTSSGNDGLKDSVDIWPRRKFLTLTSQALFNGTTFDIKPEQQYPSGSSFVLGMRVWGLAKGMKHHPEIRLTVDQGDTIITVVDSIAKDGYFQTLLKSAPTKRVKRVYGSIRLDNGDMSYYKIFIDSLNLMRYNYGTEAIKMAPGNTIKKAES